MWPFTSRRIFGNRWWAVAFVAFVCWQIADIFGDTVPPNSTAARAAPALPDDANRSPVDDAQMNAMVETLNTLEKMK